MSFRDTRKLITSQTTDEQTKNDVKTKLEILQSVASDKGLVSALKGNAVFIAILDYLDEKEEGYYRDLKAVSSIESTNFTRGQLDTLNLFRKIMIAINE